MGRGGSVIRKPSLLFAVKRGLGETFLLGTLILRFSFWLKGFPGKMGKMTTLERSIGTPAMFIV